MSTRSVIARAEGDAWAGRYHHHDGYPTGVGARLWEMLHNDFGGNVEAMLHVLVDMHPAGWSSVWGDPGKPSGFGSPDGMKCYCHGTRAEGAQLITATGDDDGGAEWAYIFSPSVLTIEKRFGSMWRFVGCYSVTGSEPDWQLAEKAGYAL